MGSSIKTVWNEDTISEIVLDRLISFWYFVKLFSNWANNLECNFNLFFWFVCLDCCTDNCDVCVGFADTMDRWHHHDIDVYIMINLPFFLFSCFCGMIIWTEGMSPVLGMGWSRIQIQRTTFSTNLTRSWRPHFKA